MQTMEVSTWDGMTTIISTKALAIQYAESSDRYEIFLPEAQTFLWHITLLKDGGADVTNFESVYKANANKPLEIKAGVERPIRVSTSPQPIGTYNKWRGFQCTMDPGVTYSFVDIQFPTQVFFRGGYLYTNDADVDDTMSADVLLATNDSVLMSKMIDSVPVASGILLPFLSDESMAFPNYYKLRLSFSCPDGISETQIRRHNIMVEFFQ